MCDDVAIGLDLDVLDEIISLSRQTLPSVLDGDWDDLARLLSNEVAHVDAASSRWWSIPDGGRGSWSVLHYNGETWMSGR